MSEYWRVCLGVASSGGERRLQGPRVRPRKEENERNDRDIDVTGTWGSGSRDPLFSRLSADPSRQPNFGKNKVV